MRGFWSGNYNPIFATGNDFLEKFKFVIPRGGLFLYFITVVPYYMIKSAIYPNYEYKLDVYGEELIVKYEQDGNKVEGEIFWTYRDQDDATDYQTSYTLKSKFKGQVSGNTLNITLDNPNIEKPAVIYRELPANQTLYIDGDKISFMGKTANGGRCI